MFKTIFYAMERKTLAKFQETSDELLSVARTMTTEARQSARKEIMEAAVVYDISEDMEDHRELYSVDSEGTAIIPVSGKLTSQVDICDGFFSDVTTYGFISAAAIAADNDMSVKHIKFRMSSGGGVVTGLDNAAQVLANLQKPTEAEITGMCASACYWLASQLDKIVATSPTDFIGSIGVAMDLVDTSKADENRGVKRYTLSSTDAPDKRPDIGTESGRAKYVEELDALHNVFVRRVSEGRGVSPETINKDFGKGGVLIAEIAMERGMIDIVQGKKTPAVAGKKTREVQQMNLAELLAENPAAKAEHEAAIAAAEEKGEKAGKEAMTAVVEAVSPFLTSSEYPETVKKTAVEALKGEQTVANFRSVVAAVDAVREENATTSAQGESEDQPETPAQQAEIPKAGDVIKDQAGIDAEIARMKGGN